MSSLLIVHICAGSFAILSGAMASSARKGGQLHRLCGGVFVLSMLVMAALGVYLAIFGPQPNAGAAPPKASVAVGLLTLYLVMTAWLSARRTTVRVDFVDYILLLFALGVTAALLTFAAQAHVTAPEKPGGYVPYLVFAGFAVLLSVLDINVIKRGGSAGTARVARHLWRMCFALFFATAFFFLGQQKVMPTAMRGSPALILISIAPLALMAVWLVLIRFTKLGPKILELGSG